MVRHRLDELRRPLLRDQRRDHPQHLRLGIRREARRDLRARPQALRGADTRDVEEAKFVSPCSGQCPVCVQRGALTPPRRYPSGMTQLPFDTISTQGSFGGTVGFYKHASGVNACTMKFAVFTPPQARERRVPVLYYLAGLTCTEETFMIKAGAQRVAAELGLMLVAPDTSPRGVPLPGDSDSWDFGVGAGFYVDSTQEPWARHYKMYSYVTLELPQLVDAHFPTDTRRQGIFGHSMGGHGALTIGLKNLQRYRSISAFAPIAAPMQVPWGQKAFTGYLGPDQSQWKSHDATELVRSGRT